MESNLVIGILNIVEDKLREYGVQLPADEREDSTDPIIGYDYAELHDRICEYLEDQGIVIDADAPAKTQTVYGVSMVNSDGFANGKASCTYAYSSLEECIDKTHQIYLDTWKECKECNVLDGDRSPLTRNQFQRELTKHGCVCIQCLDSHVNFDFFKQDIGLQKEQNHNKKRPLSEQIHSAASHSQKTTPGIQSIDLNR